MTSSWLPLTDYSMKYKVSVSTLRRRIKTDDINFRFSDGKYLILDSPPDQSPSRAHRPSLNSEEASKGIFRSAPSIPEDAPELPLLRSSEAKDEPILIAANKLLNELKQAYTRILQEKEEQMLHLKEEVSDLKTLVRVLESENQRLKERSHSF